MWPPIVKLRSRHGSSHTVCAAGERLPASCVLLFWVRACMCVCGWVERAGLTEIWTILYCDWWELEKGRIKDDNIITVWTAHTLMLCPSEITDQCYADCSMNFNWNKTEILNNGEKGWERLYIRYSGILLTIFTFYLAIPFSK